MLFKMVLSLAAIAAMLYGLSTMTKQIDVKETKQSMSLIIDRNKEIIKLLNELEE